MLFKRKNKEKKKEYEKLIFAKYRCRQCGFCVIFVLKGLYATSKYWLLTNKYHKCDPELKDGEKAVFDLITVSYSPLYEDIPYIINSTVVSYNELDKYIEETDGIWHYIENSKEKE